MPPLESTISSSLSTCLPPGAQASWSFVNASGVGAGGFPFSLKLPLIDAQPVGSAITAGPAAVSAAPLPNAFFSDTTFVVFTYSAGGNRRAQPLENTAATISAAPCTANFEL